MRILTIIVVVLLALGTALVITDCSFGSKRYFQCQVSAHHYVPSKTQIHTDADGHVTTEIDPEEFHIICQDGSGANVFDVRSNRQQYYTVSNGQPVCVAVRIGRISKSAYLPRIVRSAEDP